MKRSFLLLALLLAVVACSPADTGGDATSTSTAEAAETTLATTTTTAAVDPTTTVAADAGFPVTVEADNGAVTIEDRPERVISLSSTATEMLFAVGAGEQVVAVDEQSNYPAEAPVTDLSGFTPNIEAILAYEPDLVVIGYDPGDLVASLEAADVDVLNFNAAFTLDDTYRQIDVIGTATGHTDDAAAVNDQIQGDLARIATEAPGAEGVTYFHEIDNTLFTATSTTFVGQIYGLFGLENIADEADADGSAFGYPQLSSEYVVAADPALIFLADALYGETPETVAARPGWDLLSAVANGTVIELDADIASRWGPRIVDFAEAVAAALEIYASNG